MLVGGNTHQEEFQAKEKFINSLHSDEDTAVTVEENIMGNLLIKSESNNKYADLKRSLIKSMTQRQNRYSNSKAAIYTLFFKYVPEHTNKNKESTKICDWPDTGV